MRRADPHRALIRAVLARHPDLSVIGTRIEPWASATFTGMRHILHCAPAMVAGLEEAEFTLPGHVVADLWAETQADATLIEALTIETD